MASFIYLYSKFTEEFLLLTAAGSFTLLALYCYTWVVKKRRLGAARNQVPAGMVKIYLNQLINEAQFVRTQLFGLVGDAPPPPGEFAAHFQATPAARREPETAAHSFSADPAPSIPSDLLERLSALEKQLSEKESMVVNINVEKTKLLEELEHVKKEKNVAGAAPVSGNQEALVQKVKALEERLEEYALFEDDLANLKRLQQENAQLKKRVEEAATYEQKAKPDAAPAASREPSVLPSQDEGLLDLAAIEALLEGTSATPPTPMEEALSQELENSTLAALSPPTPIQAAKPASPSDEFEHLVDSVEDSLAKEIEAILAAPVAQAPVAPSGPTQAAPVEAAASTSSPLASTSQMKASASMEVEIPVSEKSDEELLKEFENLLNS